MRTGRKGVLQQLVAIAVVLASCWVCSHVARYVWDAAPGLRFKLRQTVRSLPLPPEGVLLLSREEISEGGSDCDAYAFEHIYGTERPLEDIVRYYQHELVADGWRDLHGFDSDHMSVAAFRRGRDEYLELFSRRYVHQFSYGAIRVSEQMNQFSTVYGLVVGRHCLLHLQ